MKLEPPLRILMVEDNPNITVTTKMSLERQLQELLAVDVAVVIRETIADGIIALKETDFDIAILDIRFDDGSDRSGTDILDLVTESFSIPVIVYSGFPGDLGDRYASNEKGFIYVAETKEVHWLVSKIVEWNNGHVFDIFSKRGLLQNIVNKAVRNTIWNNISPNWEHLRIDDEDALTSIVGRILATALLDELSNSIGMGEEVKVHHGEIYISTTRRHLAVGDIIRDNDEGFLVVLTPNCDLVPRSGKGAEKSICYNSQCVLYCRGIKLKDYANKDDYLSKCLDKYDTATDENGRERAMNKINDAFKHTINNKSGRLFFLPPFGDFEGIVIDFSNLLTHHCTSTEIDKSVKGRVISLTRDMSAELASRYARYMIRMGQPEYQREPLTNAVKEIMQPRAGEWHKKN